MLSTFIFVRVLSIKCIYTANLIKLWFAFNFYLCQSSFNGCKWNSRQSRVVICFQLLSLSEFFQFRKNFQKLDYGCDLLSTFIFVRVLSMWVIKNNPQVELWFAFNFYLCQSSFNIHHQSFHQSTLWFAFNFYLCQSSFNPLRRNRCFTIVVICFQLLSLSEFFQLRRQQYCCRSGCDLLSTFIFVRVLSIAR